VSVWAHPISTSKLQLHVRDSVNPETGAPSNEGEARCDFSTSSTIMVNGLSSVEIMSTSGGWQRVSTDVRTADGHLFVYVGMLRSGDNSHAFEADGEQLLFGGIEVVEIPPT
jgi:hypothetical protein